MGLTCAINPKAYLDAVMKLPTNIQFTDLSYGALQYIGVMCIVMAMRCHGVGFFGHEFFLDIQRLAAP